MKTVLIVLGSLFVLSRLNHGNGVLSLGGNAAPAGTAFSPTPAAGGAASLIPPGGSDPYANLQGGGGGAGPLPVQNGGSVGGGTGTGMTSLFTPHTGILRPPNSGGVGGTGVNARVVRTGVRTA